MKSLQILLCWWYSIEANVMPANGMGFQRGNLVHTIQQAPLILTELMFSDEWLIQV